LELVIAGIYASGINASGRKFNSRRKHVSEQIACDSSTLEFLASSRSSDITTSTMPKEAVQKSGSMSNLATLTYS